MSENTPTTRDSTDTTAGSVPAHRPSGNRASNRRTAAGSPKPRGSSMLKSKPRRAAQQRWARKLHNWLSMFALTLVLFFGATGLLLNHPDWSFGIDPVTTTSTGTLPTSVTKTDAESVANYLRDQKVVFGAVESSRTASGTLTVSTAGPGATSSFSVNTSTGAYKTTMTRSGMVAFFEDLHRGNAVGRDWGWVVDATALILIAISLTGLVIGVLNRSRHWMRDMGLALGGLLVAVALLFLSAP